jgi:phospholipid N-methyltransferase
MAPQPSVIDSVATSVRFLREFVRAPKITGAVAPSSPALAETIVQWIDWPHTRALLEWGPGTGSFTARILARKPSHSRYMAMEINPELCEVLRERFPNVELHQESVANVAQLCHREGIEQVDCVVSGLPWASFSDAMQDQFLEAMMGVLRKGGQFTTFAYIHGIALPAGRSFRQKLRRYFSEVSESEVVWLNLPPAFVYRCRR